MNRPNEEWRIQVSLQSSNLCGDSRLREVQLTGCFRDFAGLGNHQEGMQ